MTYQRYIQKWASKFGGEKVSVNHFDYFAFHSPYNKLVQKGFGRLFYTDARQPGATVNEALAPFTTLDLSKSYESRELDMALRSTAAADFKSKVMPCCKINQIVGNCYTGSVYSSLLSVVCDQGASLTGKRVLMFSYGSGSVASLFSIKGLQGWKVLVGKHSVHREYF